MSALVCGSLAFDSIATFPGRFADQILPNQLHILNVSFLVPTLRREFGGCAGNIAYNLAALGGEPVVVAAVGSDGADYLARLRSWGVDDRAVRTDRRRLHRAGLHHHRPRQQPDHRLPPGRDAVGARDDGRRRAATSRSRSSRPTAASAMLRARRAARRRRSAVHLRPGPGPADVRRRRAARASSTRRAGSRSTTTKREMLAERTGLIARGDVAVAPARHRRHPRRARLRGLAARRADGACPASPATEVVDPTGCGDAFRAAMLFGLERGWPLATLRRARQPPRRAQDRQPRRPESCAGSHDLAEV